MGGAGDRATSLYVKFEAHAPNDLLPDSLVGKSPQRLSTRAALSLE